MSSIRWSALFLSLAAPFACAPHYDVGDGDGGAAAGSGGDAGSSMTGGSGGSGNASSGGTGGSSGTNGSGGKSATGGSGGSGEVGGSSAGGTDATGGTGGSLVAGTGGGMMMPPPGLPCGEPAEFEYASLATPEVVWERISQFLFGELRDPPSELPAATTPEWAVQILRQVLALSRFSSSSSDTALVPFMQRFLDAEPEGAISDPPHEYWARVITASAETRLSILFEGDEESNPPFGLFGTVAAEHDSITHRGRFLSERLYCTTVEGPPPNDHPLSLMVEPNQTRRDALFSAINEPVCAGCHFAMDPLGFPLEVLTPDTLEYRTTENGVPIDTSGNLHGFEFADIQALGEHLSESCEVARCLAQQLFDEAVPGGDPSVGPTVQLNNAVYRFAAPDSPEDERFRFQTLLEAIVSSPAFLE
jgi:hypothetical protein